jgi:transketolase
VNLKQKAKQIRRDVVDLLYRHKACHLGSCMSCIEILVALYFKIMKPEDKFLLSKGWAAAALYSVLAEKGIIDWDDLYENYYEPDSKYWGLVHHTVPGIEHSFGSAGHGLPVAVGMALADSKKRIFVLISDGECQAGTFYESILFGAQHKLNNLIVLVDNNRLQAFGRTKEVLNIEPLDKRVEKHGWKTQRIDGHNIKEIIKACKNLSNKKPNMIICDTVKGKGISFAEDKMEWHYYNLTSELYERAKDDLR